MQTFYDFHSKKIDGTKQSMSEYKGQVILVVNVASQCAFTPQYEALQKLYESYQYQGFKILAFPCNQFREQESGTAQEIQDFCDINYNIGFPLFKKVEVNGKNTEPLYMFLKKEAKGILGTQSIKWNFTKFLIDRDGNVIRRYSPSTKPENIQIDIKELLQEFVVNKEI